MNQNNILTLFVPAGVNSSQAWGQPVRCDKLHVVEVPRDGCAVQISIIERYGTHTTYGEARSWDERHVQTTHAGMQRGPNVFHAQYRKEGSPKLRHIFVYAALDGSPESRYGDDGGPTGNQFVAQQQTRHREEVCDYSS